MLLAPFVVLFSLGCNQSFGEPSGMERAVSRTLTCFKKANQGEFVEHPFGTDLVTTLTLPQGGGSLAVLRLGQLVQNRRVAQ
jgi:hypothetical protein